MDSLAEPLIYSLYIVQSYCELRRANLYRGKEKVPGEGMGESCLGLTVIVDIFEIGAVTQRFFWVWLYKLTHVNFHL